MKVTVERAELLKSLSHVHRVVERRNTIPILANVLIKADKSQLAFKATDLDLEIDRDDRRRGRARGSTTVPAHMFYEIVRKLPEGAQIVLEAQATAPCSRSAPAAPASPCRRCRRATFPISPPAR